MLRIVAGALGGRRIKAPPGRGTRPTAERVREGVFSMLTHRLDFDGLCVLDLFAGSGAYGIEALSRGARHATFVESHRRTAQGIRDNLRALALPAARWTVIDGSAERYLDKLPPGEPWRAIFVDPPYAAGAYDRVLRALAVCPRVAPQALVVVECPAGDPPALPAGLEQIQANRYGDTQVILCRKTL
ncbi:MAG: 16S rRNA (guanine(966)-N(2))-methyltransferase RsmD [Candidatus Lambdaproteobacteria bacterium]|nr:16S rRNA (guanine(966)-N(2))-methyltransferase RsmD [Candidatus Lambdaproteobacteria bacterium]